jgi:hypothetical protein
MVAPAVVYLTDRLRRLARPDRWVDRWIALIVTGFILAAPLAGWTMLRGTSPPRQISFDRTPAAMPSAPTASFVIEPIIHPARPASSSLSPTATRTKKRAPSKRQWVASLSRPTWRGR